MAKESSREEREAEEKSKEYRLENKKEAVMAQPETALLSVT